MLGQAAERIGLGKVSTQNRKHKIKIKNENKKTKMIENQRSRWKRGGGVMENLD